MIKPLCGLRGEGVCAPGHKALGFDSLGSIRYLMCQRFLWGHKAGYQPKLGSEMALSDNGSLATGRWQSRLSKP